LPRAWLISSIVVLSPSLRENRRAGTLPDHAALGRFAEPRLLRAAEMLTAPDEIEYARAEVTRAHLQR
jgi:hypothetical protein